MKEGKQSCVIDDHCGDSSGCCMNRQCVESKQCFNVYALPLIIGISVGIGLFLIIFSIIYIYTEMKKPKSVFREEATAEDRLIKREFPKAKPEVEEELDVNQVN
jgi:hypothetical protein